MSIRVLIADDHPIVRDGLRFSIEHSKAGIEVVAEASNGMEALELAKTSAIDIFILDITMPKLNGIDTTRELLRHQPGAKVIILSLHCSQAMVEQALTAGARGYLTKEAATRNLVEAVREVHADRCFLSPDIARYVVSGFTGQGRSKQVARDVALTAQEKKVLQLVAEGLSTKEIADKFNRSVNTIHAHRNHLMAKLGLHKNADLVRYAIREGIAKP